MQAEVGKLLILIGIILVFLGVALLFVPWLRPGQLPGDFVLRRGNWTLYVPLATGLLLSIILTLVIWLVQYLRK